MAKFGRLARLIVASFLIWFITIGITSASDELNFGFVLALVLSFWTTTTLIQVALCVRFSERKDGSQNFRIGTIFLIMSYIGIYLVPIRLAIQGILRVDRNLELPDWITIGVVMLVSCVLLSIMQLVVAEAIVSTLVDVRKHRRRT